MKTAGRRNLPANHLAQHTQGERPMRTEHLAEGTFHFDCDGLALPDPPRELRLESTVARRRHANPVRAWFVRWGSESWHFQDDDCESVLAWLKQNGYVARDTVPPGAFEFVHKGMADADLKANQALPTIC